MEHFCSIGLFVVIQFHQLTNNKGDIRHMKQEWDISAIKEPKYLPDRKVWEVYGVLPKEIKKASV